MPKGTSCPRDLSTGTHMDAQVAWDPLGTCWCWHGLTSVLMGNSGFTLAPCREADKELVLRNLERAEDISPAALAGGLQFVLLISPAPIRGPDSKRGFNPDGERGRTQARLAPTKGYSIADSCACPMRQ